MLNTVRKNYRASSSHSSRMFTVQCAFRHPKLIVISVMDECDGISTSMSILVPRFKELSAVCYYDDACNFRKSIILRTPWINESCKIACDRFHYHSHKRNVVCDPDIYISCSRHQKSSAESINQRWNLSKSYIRFLGSKSLMPFLAIRAIFINISALIYEKYETHDIDEAHYRKILKDSCDCSCMLCRAAEMYNDRDMQQPK